jgi:hypothetical protein
MARGLIMRIAALDDDPAQLERVERVLTEAGHKVQGFPLAKTLVAALRRETFDLLVLDWNLPDMTGVETIGWVRANLETPPPVLLQYPPGPVAGPHPGNGLGTQPRPADPNPRHAHLANPLKVESEARKRLSAGSGV